MKEERGSSMRQAMQTGESERGGNGGRRAENGEEQPRTLDLPYRLPCMLRTCVYTTAILLTQNLQAANRMLGDMTRTVIEGMGTEEHSRNTVDWSGREQRRPREKGGEANVDPFFEKSETYVEDFGLFGSKARTEAA
jgi:hypothetical protein